MGISILNILSSHLSFWIFPEGLPQNLYKIYFQFLEKFQICPFSALLGRVYKLFYKIQSRKIIHKNIFPEIIGLDNLFLAWKEFKKGKKNKMEIQEFEFNLEDNLFRLHRELADKIYRHSNYTAFYVKDPKLRHIHKAAVRDRVLHHAVFRILYPIFDQDFIYDSYSCRLGKGTHRAVARLEKFARKLSGNYRRNIFALKCDIRKFFDSIDQGVLLNLIKKQVKDEEATQLVLEIIQSFKKSAGVGLPLGNVTSQLFANIYMNEFDQFIKHKLKVKHYLRYTDDFIIVHQNENYLKALLLGIAKFLQEKLKLNLHINKVILRTLSQGIDFLGYVVLPYHRVLRTKTKRRIFKKVNAANLQSYWGVLKHCNGYKIEQQINCLYRRGVAGESGAGGVGSCDLRREGAFNQRIRRSVGSKNE